MKSLLMSLLCFFVVVSACAESELDNGYNLKHKLVLDPTSNIEAMVYDARYVHHMAHKGVDFWLGIQYPTHTLHPLDVLWDFYSTFLVSVTITHELGHYVRVQEYGGNMEVKPVDLLRPGFIPGHITLPPSATDDERHIVHLGGFEGNSIYAFQQEKSFLVYQAVRPDTLPAYIVNKLFYPLYAYVIKPVSSGSDLQVWNEAGDPKNHVFFVYKRQGNPVLLDGQFPVIEGNVPAGVKGLHGELKEKSLYTLLDPSLLWSFYAMWSIDKYVRPPIIKISDNFSWIYGVQFVPSIFGYDMYATQYMKVFDYDISLYLRDGGPMKSEGWGASVNNLVELGSVVVGLDYETWDQDTYGSGKSYSIFGDIGVGKSWGVTMKVSKKDSGYLIGQPLDSATIGYVGMTYSF